MMKPCICCGITKDILYFHKHKGMADGHLNKCKQCVIDYIVQWRIDNPEARKVEHAKNRVKKGIKTREQYFEAIKSNAIGRRATLLKYGHKRRIKTKMPLTEFDSFVLEQAADLAKKRETLTGTKWHIDHIIPLMSKQASGLHNGFNIQVVPALWNIKKGNRSMDTFFPTKEHI